MNKTYKNGSLPHHTPRNLRTASLRRPDQDVKAASPAPQVPKITEKQQFSLGRYRVRTSDLLGKGFCSKVYKAVDSETDQEVALKLIDLQQIKSVVHRRFLKNEIECLKRLRNQKHIINLIEIIQTKTHLAIVSELCLKSLSQKMKSKEGIKRPLQIQEALRIFQESVLGYMEMKAEGYVHRDIKPANILIAMDGTIKLCDLGFATRESRINEDRFVNVGSPLYMAPETMKENLYSTKADIWALGLVFLEMINGKLPWQDVKESDLRRVIMETKFEELLPKELDLKWKVMLLSCLEVNPKKRCNALQLLHLLKPDQTSSQLTVEPEQSKKASSLRAASLGSKQNKRQSTSSVTTMQTEQLEDGGTKQKNSRPESLESRQKMTISEQKSQEMPFSLKRNHPYARTGQPHLSSRSSSKKIVLNPHGKDLVSLKLGEPQGASEAKLKKEHLPYLNLIRLLFQSIQLLVKAQDNIHCTYLHISKALISKMADTVLFLFADLRQQIVAWQQTYSNDKPRKEDTNFTELVKQYEKNYREYFSIRLQVSATEDSDVEGLVGQLKTHLRSAEGHFRLVLEEILQSKLSQITDSQLCEFIWLVDTLNALVQLLRLNRSSSGMLARTTRIEELLKRGGKSWTIDELKKMSRRTIS